MAKTNYNPVDYVTFHVRKDRKNRDGSKSILTLVRVPNFKRVSKTFKTRSEAEAWAISLVAELTKQATGEARPEISSLTIGGLIKEYLDDPAVHMLKSYDGYADPAQFWIANYADIRVLDCGIPKLRDARDKLRKGKRKSATVNRYLSVMRGIWNWGRSAGWIPLE
jgi:hypothetical protein